MRPSQRKITLGLALAAAVMLMLSSAATAGAVVSTKLLSTGQFGWNVNKTKVELGGGATRQEKNVCTLISKDTCQRGSETHEGGGFEFAFSVATDPTSGNPASGNVYVADNNNERIEEFTAGGAFILTFGWNVNETKVNLGAGATQAEKNLCTQAEIETKGVKCKAGEEGTGLAEQLNGPQDVAVDPETHNVYVLELWHRRIDEYTPGGKFVLMVGGNVNKTKVTEGAPEAAKNLCTAASHDICQPGEFAPTGPAHGAFKEYPDQFRGNLLAVGGPEHLLYATDQGRLQEFASSGEWKGEVSLASVLSSTARPTALAVSAACDIYVTGQATVAPDAQIGGIHELDCAGKEVPGFAGSEAGKTTAIVYALALDPGTGRLAAVEAVETLSGQVLQSNLYDGNGARLSGFEPPGGMRAVDGLAFNAADELYAAEFSYQDIGMYAPAPVPEPVTKPCKNQTASAITLAGEVNPNNVAKTEAWFQYGKNPALGLETPHQPITPIGNVFVPIEATLPPLGGPPLPPDEVYYYRAAAEGEIDQGQPELAKQTLTCQTLLVAPKIEGEPEAGYVTFSSAVLFGALNPENAKTESFFEYGPCKEELTTCGTVLKTTVLESSAYGLIGVVLGANDLQPSTTYRYRLVAVNHSKNGLEHAEAAGTEASFTTPHAPHPTASTEPVSNVTATSATLSGIVNPDGAGATYAFQVGIDNGVSTVYSTVAQGPTGSGAVPVPESFTLTGLQPGTPYAYRVTIASAYGVSEGAPVTFKTAGLPEVVFPPPVLAQLPVPNIAFPKEPMKVIVKKLTRAQQLARALKACAKQPKSKRAACKRSARKKYVVSKKARKSGPRGKGAHRTRR
jgi:hypothetical protein